MTSPIKRQQRQSQSTTARLAGQSLPLHVALAHVIVNLFPQPATPSTQASPQVNCYSATFTSDTLTLVAREVYEVSDVPIEFQDLVEEVNGLVRAEKAGLERANAKLRARGQVIPRERAIAGKEEDWMAVFVSVNPWLGRLEMLTVLGKQL
jgi:hypothetical protein